VNLLHTENKRDMPLFDLALFCSMSKQCFDIVKCYRKFAEHLTSSNNSRVEGELNKAILAAKYRFKGNGLGGFSQFVTFHVLTLACFRCTLYDAHQCEQERGCDKLCFQFSPKAIFLVHESYLDWEDDRAAQIKTAKMHYDHHMRNLAFASQQTTDEMKQPTTDEGRPLTPQDFIPQPEKPRGVSEEQWQRKLNQQEQLYELLDKSCEIRKRKGKWAFVCGRNTAPKLNEHADASDGNIEIIPRVGMSVMYHKWLRYARTLRSSMQLPDISSDSGDNDGGGTGAGNSLEAAVGLLMQFEGSAARVAKHVEE